MWPLVAARIVSVVLFGAVALAARRFTLPARAAMPTIALSGIFDMAGNVLYLVALRHTIIAIAAVLTSLYPASTVLLARFVLGERLVAVQWIGVATALVAVGLIASGR
jgi:drug/metabolite transporter (DMT)-like permease